MLVVMASMQRSSYRQFGDNAGLYIKQLIPACLD
ncbi:MAG: hypothetical protein ACI9GB_003337, partial [Halioglobus sp.]